MACIVGVHTSYAYTDKEINDLYDLSLEELLEISFTSSTLQNETIQSVPSSISVYERDEIKQLGFTRLAELMNYVPGIQAYRIDNSWPRYAHSVRGRRLGAAPPEILILIDGVRMNNNWRGSGTGHNPYISLDNIERVEFIRGPGSSIYGSNAFLGVISLTTSKRNELGVAASPYGNDQQAHGTWKKEDRELSLFVTRKSYNGQNYSIYDPDRSVQTLVETKDPLDFEKVYVTTELGGFSAHFDYNRAISSEFYSAGLVSNEQNHNSFKTSHLDINQKIIPSEQSELDFQFYFVNRDLNVRSVFSKAINLGGAASVDEREWGTSVKAHHNPNESTRLVFGAEYREPKMNNLTGRFFGSLNDEVLIGKESKQRVNALFSQLQYKINTQWEYLLGLRRDHYSNFGSHNSPRLSLLYHHNKGNTLKLLYGEAFRAPTRRENDIINAPTSIGNEKLQPEISKTLELVWSHLFKSGFFQATLFDVLITDSIVDDNTPEPQKKINGEDQTMGGLEIEWKQCPTARLQYRGSFTHIFNEVKDNNTESNILLSGSISYFLNNWTLSAKAFYQDEKINSVETSSSESEFIELDSKLEMDVNVIFKMAKNFEPYLKIKNIFDDESYSPTEQNRNIIGTPNESRLIEIGVSYLF